MEMMVHCSHCRARLIVSKQAAGHSAKCKRCKQVFKVPGGHDMVEDTIACWLEIEEEEEDKSTKPLAAPRPDNPVDELPPIHEEEMPPPEVFDEALSAELTPLSETPAEAGQAVAVAEVEAPAQAASHQDPDPAYTDSHHHHREMDLMSLDPIDLVAPLPGEEEEEEEEQPKPVAAPVPVAVAEAPAVVASPAPALPPGSIHLQLLSIQANRVLLAFDSKLLERASFRASMPMCCAVCGRSGDAAKLIARPMAWIDKTNGSSDYAEQIESRYALPVPAHQTARDLLAAMRQIEVQRSPFNNPMPYYLCGSCPTRSRVFCHTCDSVEGIQCEAMIPSVDVAMEWLGRVNGICGDDYLQLETLKSKSADQDEIWQAIPQKVRQRLSVWFEYAASERFQAYWSDSEFPKSDAGLAGIVLTDQRLVFCRYHHHGSVNLADKQITLRSTSDGVFCDLTMTRGGAKSKLVLLRPADVADLAERLVKLRAGLRLEKVEA